MRVCARACVRARVCVCVFVCVCAYKCVRACVRTSESLNVMLYVSRGERMCV